MSRKRLPFEKRKMTTGISMTHETAQAVAALGDGSVTRGFERMVALLNLPADLLSARYKAIQIENAERDAAYDAKWGDYIKKDPRTRAEGTPASSPPSDPWYDPTPTEEETKPV